MYAACDRLLNQGMATERLEITEGVVGSGDIMCIYLGIGLVYIQSVTNAVTWCELGLTVQVSLNYM